MNGAKPGGHVIKQTRQKKTRGKKLAHGDIHQLFKMGRMVSKPKKEAKQSQKRQRLLNEGAETECRGKGGENNPGETVKSVVTASSGEEVSVRGDTERGNTICYEKTGVTHVWVRVAQTKATIFEVRLT